MQEEKESTNREIKEKEKYMVTGRSDSKTERKEGLRNRRREARK